MDKIFAKILFDYGLTTLQWQSHYNAKAMEWENNNGLMA